MVFDWDPAKRDKVLAERGVDLASVVAIFAGPCLEREDARQDYGETRMIAVGRIKGDFFTVVYTDRASVRWIITAWPSNRKERAAWQRSL